MLQSIWKFIQYWYFRYLLVTELYMVEKWERVVIHIVFIMVFSTLSYFNSAVFLTWVGYITKPLFNNSNLGIFAAGHSFLEGSRNIMS